MAPKSRSHRRAQLALVTTLGLSAALLRRNVWRPVAAAPVAPPPPAVAGTLALDAPAVDTGFEPAPVPFPVDTARVLDLEDGSAQAQVLVDGEWADDGDRYWIATGAPWSEPPPEAPPEPTPAPPVRARQILAPFPAPLATPVLVSGRLIWPVRGTITTPFSSWHPGIDIAGPLGTVVVAADGGTVTFAGWDATGYGNRVVLRHDLTGRSTTYNHLLTIGVGTREVVRQGQLIGLRGSTGHSTGPHLHFEVKERGQFVNPLAVLP